jgi:hypothetical protein
VPSAEPRRVAALADVSRALDDAACAPAAAKLQAVAAANADAIAANLRVLHGGRDKVEALHAALRARQGELDAAARAVIESPVFAACTSDDAFARAIGALGDTP